MPKLNVGGLDRTIRIALGLTLITLVFLGPQTPWGWLGLLPFATGVIGWCPLYAVLGIDTCRHKAPKPG